MDDTIFDMIEKIRTIEQALYAKNITFAEYIAQRIKEEEFRNAE